VSQARDLGEPARSGREAEHSGGEDTLEAENARLRAELESARAELATYRQLVAGVAEAEDQGRRRIAQLIHDDSLQTLLAAHQELIEAAPGRAQVERAHEVLGAAIARLREAVVALHPVTLERGGLEQALGAVAGQAERQGGFEVEIELDGDALDHHDELVLAVARELLTNAARHSGARRVDLRLRSIPGAIELEVADDGTGMEPGRRERALGEGHIGLASVTERVQQAGGAFELESSRHGTVASARVPVARPEAAETARPV
jgi:two-component system, NarL family, sensor kinase